MAAQRGSDVDRPGPAEHPDDQVAQYRHNVWHGAGADLEGVLAQGDVADVVQRLDRPVPAQQVGQAGGRTNWNGRLVIAYTVTVYHLRVPGSRVLRVTSTTWAAWGKPKPLDADVFERVSTRP